MRHFKGDPKTGRGVQVNTACGSTGTWETRACSTRLGGSVSFEDTKVNLVKA